MAIVQIQDNKIELPNGILNQLHLTNGQEVEIEVEANNQLKIKPTFRKGAKERLKELLDEGFHMGKIYTLNREAIYNEVD